MKVADKIRSAAAMHVREARAAGYSQVSIKAGDIVRELNLRNLTPSVCNALVSPKFLQENEISIEGRTGPPSGMSTTTEITYRLSGAPNTPTKRATLFHELRGAAKQAFKDLGGGENFILSERKAMDSQ